MKTIKQSYTVLQDLEPITQIASRARLCYKSEDKAKEDEKPFLKRISDHQPVFEMAVVSIEIVNPTTFLITSIRESNYLQLSIIDNFTILVTGSIRAWNEFLYNNMIDSIAYCLNYYDNFLFDYNVKTVNWHENNCAVVDIDIMRENISDDIYKKHKFVAVHIVTNRVVTHELVRHRPVSYLQESQRYCRYDQDKFGNEITFIYPTAFFKEKTSEMLAWYNSCEDSEYAYFKLLNMKGVSPQSARLALNNSCKTEIIAYCNLKEWEHIFNRRTAPAADPGMREIMIPIHEKFKKIYPNLLDNPKTSIGG